MKGFGKQFDALGGFHAATNALALVACFFLFFLMLYVTGDVIGRYVFLKPLPGAYELAETFMAFIVFLGLAYGERVGIHIRLLTIPKRFGTLGRGILDILCYSVGVFLIGLIVWQAWGWAWASWLKMDYMEGFLNFPYYPSKFIAAIGMSFFLVMFVIELVQRIRQVSRRGQT